MKQQEYLKHDGNNIYKVIVPLNYIFNHVLALKYTFELELPEYSKLLKINFPHKTEFEEGKVTYNYLDIKGRRVIKFNINNYNPENFMNSKVVLYYEYDYFNNYSKSLYCVLFFTVITWVILGIKNYNSNFTNKVIQ